jgi:hypothetical protein
MEGSNWRRGDRQLLARAVEPNAGGLAPANAREDCLNSERRRSVLPDCGQRSRPPVGAGLLQDFQGLFNFEGKIWRTLPMLAWKPEMTRRISLASAPGHLARGALPVHGFAMFAMLNLRAS